jgi:hypothetical protein
MLAEGRPWLPGEAMSWGSYGPGPVSVGGGFVGSSGAVAVERPGLPERGRAGCEWAGWS